jgi:hypothetical protein
VTDASIPSGRAQLIGVFGAVTAVRTKKKNGARA